MKAKTFISATLGTLIEYYDYALYFIFLPLFSPVLFPASSAYASLVKGYVISGAAMIARPLGGLFFGYLGDHLGRRKALLGSMYGIAIATFAIGLTPSYQQIGIWATVIILVAKSIQLFCFGGEYNGAGVYVVEHTENKREAFFGSLVSAATLFGSLLAAVVAIFLTRKGIPAWSWRISFMLGGVIGVLGIIFRKNLTESPHFEKADSKQHSLRKLFKDYPLELLTGVMMGGLCTVPFSTTIIFILPVLMTKGILSASHMMMLHACLDAIAILTLMIIGNVADQKTPLAVMRIAAISLMILSFPILALVDHLTLFCIVPACILMIIFSELFFGPSNAFLKNLFPMQFRYRGCSLSFAFGMGIFGGLTPIVESYLYHVTGHFSAIALWVSFVSLMTFSLLNLARQRKLALDLKSA